MLGNEISDYKKLKTIRNKISNNTRLKVVLKSVYNCGAKVPVIGGRAAVAVVRNDKTARFVGNSSCKSPWCCPVCTAKQMAKYAAKISCGIDALKEQGQYAAMITFTIPHTSGFSCYDSTEILYNVWKAFTVHGNKVLATAKNDIFSNFMAATESKHRVRVAEYTWGSKGWHPHLHCLFWFPKTHFNEIVKYEEVLQKRWLELCKRYTIKQLLSGYPETQRKTVKAQVETRVRIMYESFAGGSSCVHISKDENGLPIRQESSQYLCGWGSDKELIGNIKEKASHDGHFTWQQILNKAIEEDELNELKPAEGSRKAEGAEDAAQFNKWWQLYFEYAEATKRQRHARINFSVHSGLMQIIKDWQKTNAYKEVIKKNNTSLVQTYGKWRTVCWFTSSQWSSICSNDLEVEILKAALEEDAIAKITDLLLRRRIPPPVQNWAASEKLEAILNAA